MAELPISSEKLSAIRQRIATWPAGQDRADAEALGSVVDALAARLIRAIEIPKEYEGNHQAIYKKLGIMVGDDRRAMPGDDYRRAHLDELIQKDAYFYAVFNLASYFLAEIEALRGQLDRAEKAVLDD